ncbi:hypothetical protein SO802_001084 [Lithocarpus litseifolius]|uniref:RNase H type-1 domain-containing protein n=1 Tax=Lithocarpus litseifolius TaxID=425828 RepID=A0AAW2DXC6_9ROSI
MTNQDLQNAGTSWQPPPQSVYKLNYDAAMFVDIASSGFGAVIRNFRGDVMAAMTAKGPAVQCSDVAELLACRKAMEFAIDAGFTDLIVEVVKNFAPTTVAIDVVVVQLLISRSSSQLEVSYVNRR